MLTDVLLIEIDYFYNFVTKNYCEIRNKSTIKTSYSYAIAVPHCYTWLAVSVDFFGNSNDLLRFVVFALLSPVRRLRQTSSEFQDAPMSSQLLQCLLRGADQERSFRRRRRW